MNPAVDRTEPEPSPGLTPLALAQMAWRRKALLALGLVVGTVLGGLAYTQKVPLYQSSAQMMVTKKPGNPLQNGSDMSLYYYYEDYLASHQVLIRSPRIVQDAVEHGQLRRLESLAHADDPVGTIIASLSVARESGSGAPNNILNLYYRSTVPGDCPVVLDAVLDSYRRYLARHFTTVSDDMVEKIAQAAATYKQVRDRIDKEYTEFKARSPLIYWKGDEATSDREDWLTRVQSMRLNLLIRRAEVQGRLESIETALKEGKGRQALLAQLTAAAQKAGGTDRRWEEDMLEMLLKEQQLLADYGPDHPDVVSLRRRMALTREFFTRESKPEANTAVQDPVEWHVRSLRQELQDAELSLKALTEMVEQEQKAMRDLERFKVQDRHYRDELERANKTVVEITQKLSEIQMLQQLGGFNAQVIAPPGAGVKINPGVYQYLLAGCMMGLLAGLGLAYLAEMTDKSFRTPEEIRRRLGLPVVGHIPLLPAPADEEPAAVVAAGIDPSLVTFHQSNSVQAEAYRGVRTALYFSAHGEVHKVIQVTSPDAGDGKSTLAANLAVSIAQSGKRIILIDADFRKPRQHKLFHVSSEVGLASVIAEQAELKDAIQPTLVENLDLLPCGPRPQNPAELLTSPRFKELLDAISEEYAWVLIDTPPLLAVSDPSVVAPRVDGVLLVIRAAKNGRPNAERAREILYTLGANVVGVIVNGAARDGRAGGYGYHYGPYQYYDYYPGGQGDRQESTGRNRARRSNANGERLAAGSWLEKLRSWWPG